MPLPEIEHYPVRFRYRFCPLCARPLERRVDDDRVRLYCPADGWTHYPMPNLAATTVVEHAGGIVVLRRAIPPDAGIWHLPIGHLEFAEPPADGALREATEETGLTLAEPVFLDFEYGPAYGDAAMFYLVFGYRARSTGGEPRINYENAEVLFPARRATGLEVDIAAAGGGGVAGAGEGRPWVAGRPLADGVATRVV